MDGAVGPIDPFTKVAAPHMALNRQQKRMLQKQGQLGPDGEPIAAQRAQPTGRPAEKRTSPREFFQQVQSELRKVVWPSRDEVIRFTAIVFTTLVLITALVAAIDFLFGESVLRLFES